MEDEEDASRMVMTVASSGEGQRKNALVKSIQRTSGLEAPIVSLAGAHGVCPFSMNQPGYQRRQIVEKVLRKDGGLESRTEQELAGEVDLLKEIRARECDTAISKRWREREGARTSGGEHESKIKGQRGLKEDGKRGTWPDATK